MIFYQGLLPAQIWDPVNKEVVVDFGRAGFIETSDKKTIALLKENGYPTRRDMLEFERTGRGRHGGFVKLAEAAEDLPSGRPPVEDLKDVDSNAQASTARAMKDKRRIPATEGEALASQSAPAEPEVVIKRKRKK